VIATKRKPAKKAAPPPVVDQVHDLSDNIMMCRDFRHAWAVEVPYYKVEDVEGGVRGALYVERTIACMRCDTKRVEFYRVLETRLERLHSKYVYPEGYMMRGAKRSDHVQDMVRREAYRRAVEAAR
jgi:hypothetical protein